MQSADVHRLAAAAASGDSAGRQAQPQECHAEAQHRTGNELDAESQPLIFQEVERHAQQQREQEHRAFLVTAKEGRGHATNTAIAVHGNSSSRSARASAEGSLRQRLKSSFLDVDQRIALRPWYAFDLEPPTFQPAPGIGGKESR